MKDLRSEIFDLPLSGKAIRIRALWSSGALSRLELLLLDKVERPGTSLLATRLNELLTGASVRLDLPIGLSGTPFQRAVWEMASLVPYGETITYGSLAKAVKCASPRAVGQALRANPLPIVIPCHRIVGKGGRLTGFSCGLEIKALLLENEKTRTNP